MKQYNQWSKTLMPEHPKHNLSYRRDHKLLVLLLLLLNIIQLPIKLFHFVLYEEIVTVQLLKY